MKKIFFAIVAVAAITFSACGGSTQAGADNDSITGDSVTIEEPISALSSALESANAEEAQSALEKAQAYIAQLQAEGKLEEAKEYVAKVQSYIAENEEKINELTNGNATIASLVSAVKAIPANTETAAEDAAAATEAAANATAAAAAEAVTETANATKEAVKETAKEKAGEAVDNAAAAVKGKLGL